MAQIGFKVEGNVSKNQQDYLGKLCIVQSINMDRLFAICCECELSEMKLRVVNGVACDKRSGRANMTNIDAMAQGQYTSLFRPLAPIFYPANKCLGNE